MGRAWADLRPGGAGGGLPTRRSIAQKVFNDYVLRIIFEGEREDPVVVTVYPARRDRYEV